MSWSSMEHGAAWSSMVQHEAAWCSMEQHGAAWSSMVAIPLVFFVEFTISFRFLIEACLRSWFKINRYFCKIHSRVSWLSPVSVHNACTTLLLYLAMSIIRRRTQKRAVRNPSSCSYSSHQWRSKARELAEKFSGGSQRKIQEQKIAPFSLPPLYQYHVWKSRGPRPPCPRCLRPCS